MDIRRLSYFLTIAEESGISKAAEKLHVAQPALSKQLKVLEEEVGSLLVERSTRHFRLTEAGHRLVHRGRQIMDLVEVTKQELRDLNEGYRGTLRIGTLASAAATLLPQRIASFSKDHPGVSFIVHDCHTHEVIELLQHGLVDIGIIRSPYDPSAYESISLPVEPMMVVTTEEPFWKPAQKSIRADALKGHPLILHNRYADQVRSVCRDHGFDPTFLNQVDDTRTLLLCAKTGMATALVQRDWLNLAGEGIFKSVILDEPALETQLVVIWQKNRYLPKVAQSFLDSFR